MFDWIQSFLAQTGYLGIAALMLLENIFPPIPSELIMPLAGFTAKQGGFNIVWVVLAGTAGSVSGALLWYYIGRRLRGERIRSLAARHGRWLTLCPDDLDRAQRWFDRHGLAAVFIGRLIPAVRTLISVPAGISNMPLGRFIIFSSLGSLIWTAMLAGAGYLLAGNYEAVATYLNPVSNAVVGVLVFWYLYRVIRFDPGNRENS